MILSSHIVVASALSAPLINQPFSFLNSALIFILSLASHFLIDMIPHRDYKVAFAEKFKETKGSIEKRELKNLYSAIVDSIRPDTILQFKELSPTPTDSTKTITKIDPEDFEFFSKVYPNPTINFVNVELQEKNKITYHLTDLNGKVVLQGQFTDITNKIDLSKQTAGIYYLTLISPTDNQKETTKIIKTK